MFFFLSKTINFFTAPMVIICMVLVLSWILKNPAWKKRLFKTGVILLLFFSNEAICNEMLLLWEVPVTKINDIKKHYEWGIVLTGITKSDVGPADRVYFNRGADRVVHTLQLYKLGLIKKILISGGSGKLLDIGNREADDMASALVMMGVSPDNIVIENDSRNTHENAVNSVAILKKITTPDQCILISSAYHLRRARACFTKLGWNVDVFSTDFISHLRQLSIEEVVIPQVDALLDWHYLFKEWIGYIAYLASGYV